MMKAHSISPISGAALALIAAGLAGQVSAAPAQAADKVELVHCSGVNSCKGHNDCKSAGNACKGQGSCKGKGFVLAPAEGCKALGGKINDPGKTKTVAASELMHCTGVNKCKGHNDCKTAGNACKGQSSCKGKGFVALPADSCKNVGGKAG